jgi:hypothetical protein
MRISVAGLALGVFAVGSAFAQQYVISAHSGVVQYVEGAAFINDNQVDPKFGQFPDVKDNQVFRTEEGRAEILLTPGAFLRLAENSSFRMVSNKLTDTRVEMLTGSAMVECDDMLKDNAITLLNHGSSMTLVKHGLYRVDAEHARFSVYEGEAIVKGESGQLTLKGGKQTALNGALMAENFDSDKKDGDDLYRWSARRSGYLSKANVSSATSLMNSGTYGSYLGGWAWNPMFGMYTYVPMRGTYNNPFGYGFYSPYSVGYAFYPGYGYGYGSGYGYYGNPGGSGSSRTSNTAYSSALGTASRSTGNSSITSTNGNGYPTASAPSGNSGGFSGGYGSGSTGGGMSSGSVGGAARGGSSTGGRR